MRKLILILFIISCSSNKKPTEGDPCAYNFNLNSEVSILDENNNIVKKTSAFIMASSGYAIDMVLYSTTTIATVIPKLAICLPPELIVQLPKAILLAPITILGVHPESTEASQFFKKCYNAYEILSYSPNIGKKIEKYFKSNSCEQAEELARPYIDYAQCHKKIGRLSSRQKAKDSYQYLIKNKYFLNCLPSEKIKQFRSYEI